MGLINWIVQRIMQKEAKRLAKLVSELYPEAKEKMPNTTETEIIKSMLFDKDSLSKSSQETKEKIDACCKTINGFCYMVALDIGKFKGWMNFRSLQFTSYMDREIINAGFPKQSIDQRREILEAMDLAIDGWQEITGDY